MTLSERINAVALDLAIKADEARDGSADVEVQALSDMSVALAQIANEMEGISVEPREGEFPTPRQGLALARFLSQVMRDERFAENPRDAYATVSRARIGVGGISENYLGVRLADGYEGGIDREGRVST